MAKDKSRFVYNDEDLKYILQDRMQSEGTGEIKHSKDIKKPKYTEEDGSTK